MVEHIRMKLTALLVSLCLGGNGQAIAEQPASNQRASEPKLGHFKIDATIPLGHRCMGILPTKSQSISDGL